MRLVFLGPPGAGKGTQAKILSKKLGIPHISTGDMLREAIASGSELGKRVETIVSSGALVSDDLMAEIVRERLSQADCSNGFILDGYPRTVNQAETLKEILKELGTKLDLVILIDVDEETLVERITSRRVCPNCHAVFNLKNNPPKKDNICDHCGTQLVQREDDTEEVVRNRYKIYLEKTHPLIEYYEREGLLKKVPGDRSQDDVTEMLLQVLEGAKKT
ncbi:MAG: adenylate kinase [Thermotogota bacterium]|nr:adenylate kinase [Thermotogota bacterium]MDK2864145.1 adenylate kinase [Thermotogota bacterium]HCZ06881.1 adenylate kinase [Thermotogota bacterium]